MQEETFETEVYTLTDENGQENDFELIGSLDIDDQTYVALFPIENEDDEDDDESGFVILKVVEEDGEDIFVSIDDEEEYDSVAEAFEDELMADIDYDEDIEDDEE